MDVDKEKQARAMAKAKQSLLQAEIKREEARLNQAAALFLQGQFDILLNDEFVENLAAHILKLYRGDQRKTAISLLERLEKSICSDSTPIRERSLMVMMILSEHIFKNNIRELSAIIARISAHWLYFETEFIAGFEPVCLKLQQIIVEMLSTEQWYEVEQLIVTMNKISNKTLLKNNLIHGVVSRVHDNLAEPAVLDILINAYLGESSQRKDVVENILINMGQQGSRFLVQRLTYSNDKQERLALVDLIPRIGAVSVPVLSSYLADKQQPWYVTRNIIMIISRLGDDRFFQEIAPHLSHEDIRVQQQVLNCIEVLGGDKMKGRLLEALQVINDELKAHLVDLLVQFKGSDIEAALLDLFEQRNNFSSHVHDFLITKLCSKLVAYPSTATIQELLDLIEDRKERYGETDSLARAATDALRKIEQNTSGDTIFAQSIEDNQLNTLIENEVMAQIPADSDHISESYSEGGLSDIFVETLTDTLANKKQTEPDQAEDPGFQPYLSQDHHLMVWSAFYEKLDTAEANTFFSILTPMKLEAGEFVVHQGDEMADLVFIDQGYADIGSSGDLGNLVFAPLQAGEIIGSEGFYQGRPWSLTIVAQAEMQVRILKKEQLAGIEDDLPDLNAKLESFCNQYDILPFLVRSSADGSPAATDHTVEIHSSLAFKNSTGKTIDSDATGGLAHPSLGGFSLILPYADMENINACLGHQVSAELIMADGSRQTSFGLVAGGGCYEASKDALHVHIKFYHPLKEKNYTCNSVHIM